MGSDDSIRSASTRWEPLWMQPSEAQGKREWRLYQTETLIDSNNCDYLFQTSNI
jgi:hypothetical protein